MERCLHPPPADVTPFWKVRVSQGVAVHEGDAKYLAGAAVSHGRRGRKTTVKCRTRGRTARPTARGPTAAAQLRVPLRARTGPPRRPGRRHGRAPPRPRIVAPAKSAPHPHLPSASSSGSPPRASTGPHPPCPSWSSSAAWSRPPRHPRRLGAVEISDGRAYLSGLYYGGKDTASTVVIETASGTVHGKLLEFRQARMGCLVRHHRCHPDGGPLPPSSPTSPSATPRARSTPSSRHDDPSVGPL
ncbi:hypothetical protein TPAU25S_00908 [Tsukamurella paurometabola]